MPSFVPGLSPPTSHQHPTQPRPGGVQGGWADSMAARSAVGWGLPKADCIGCKPAMIHRVCWYYRCDELPTSFGGFQSHSNCDPNERRRGKPAHAALAARPLGDTVPRTCYTHWKIPVLNTTVLSYKYGTITAAVYPVKSCRLCNLETTINVSSSGFTHIIHE